MNFIKNLMNNNKNPTIIKWNCRKTPEYFSTQIQMYKIVKIIEHLIV